MFDVAYSPQVYHIPQCKNYVGQGNVFDFQKSARLHVKVYMISSSTIIFQ